MLCPTIDFFESLTTIIANIVTIFGIVFIWRILKNRISKKTVHLSVEQNNSFRLTISNLTDNEFSIIGIYLVIQKNEYPAQELVSVGSVLKQKEIRHYHILPHQSEDIYCFFSFDDKKLANKKLIFKLKTTQGTLTYKVKTKDTKSN